MHTSMLRSTRRGDREPGRDRSAPFADLHNHVVPGVDDGSRSLEETLRSLRAFQAEGVGEVAVSPHLYLPFHPTASALDERLRQLRTAYEWMLGHAQADGACPELRFGQEIFAPDGASIRRVVERAEVGIAGTRFLLVEFGFDLEGRPLEVIRAVRAAGREILIAHPERYRHPPGEDPLETIRRWRDAGAYLQINLGSLVDYYGPTNPDAERLGWRMVREGLAHLLASDHHCENRPQILHRDVFDRIAERCGHDRALRLLGENPRRVLRDRPPRELEALPLEARDERRGRIETNPTDAPESAQVAHSAR